MKTDKSKFWLFTLIKIVGTCVFAFIIYKVITSYNYDFDSSELLSANFLYIGIGIVFIYLRYLFVNIKFYYLTRQKITDVIFVKHIAFEFKVHFYEMLIPVPNFEDIARFIYLRKKQVSPINSLSILLISRLTGLLTLGVLLSITIYYSSGIYLPTFINSSLLYIVPVFIIIMILLINFVFYYSSKIAFIGNSKFAKYSRLLRRSKFSKQNILIAILLSFFQFFSWAFAVYFLFKGFNLEVSIFFFLSVIPLMVLGFMLPISYQGLGLPEAVLVLYAQYLIPEINVLPPVIFHFVAYISFLFVGLVMFINNKKLFV